VSEIDALIEKVEALYRDTRFNAVREWKEAHPGAKAIGFLPIYVPRELIHAAGMLSVGVVGHGEIEIIRGDAYFQSYICHLPRSVIELGVNGSLDVLDGVIFPSTCDVVRNLSGMWKLLFKDKYAKYFDVPQNFSSEVGGTFYRGELNAIRHDLEQLGGRPITDDALRASIALYNENRALIGKLYQARADEPWLYSAYEVYLVQRAGHLLPVEEHNALIADYLEAAKRRDRPQLDNIRVVVQGAFCEQPTPELIQTLERAGCYIVNDDFLLGYRLLEKQLSEQGDPIDALVDGFLTGVGHCPSVYRVEGDNGEGLVQKVRQFDADGVVFAAPSFCDPALLEQPMAVAALEREGIPYTAFLYAENTGQYQVIREQAGTFADSIRLWGEA